MRIAVTSSALVLWLGLAAPVFAQSTTEPKAFVGGLGGVTFGTATSSILGGQVGVRIAPSIFVIGEIGRMQNVLPSEIADRIPEAEALVEAEFGVTADFDVKAPAFYGFGGVRWAQARRRIAPFAEGGAGFGHITADITAIIDGIDVSHLIDDEVPEVGDLSTTEFLLAFGGGVNIGLSSRVSADAGYRFMRIFTEESQPNTSIVYGAVKVRLGR